MEGLQGRATMAAARARPVGERWGAFTQVVVLARCDTPSSSGPFARPGERSRP